MVVLKLEVISRDTIKPSSPTPHHLRKYQFSFLDQIAPPVFMPLVTFYPPDSHNVIQRSNNLKHSLSQALTRFYPMAGRVIDNLYIDCNDEGVPFLEARAHCKLSDVISDPVPGELNKFVPYELDDVRDLSLVVQLSFFDCGGMALGVGISHKIADALSFFMFLNSWAAVARGDRDSDIPNPRFESAKLFPARAMTGFKPSTGIVKENISTKRFVFSASTIASLRDRYANSNTGERRPTRIEALSAFIWSRFMAATESKLDTNKIHTVLHAVNLRTRVDPPLPANYFGNISRLAIAVPSMDDSGDETYEIVNKMREAISNVNGGYVAKLREGDKHLNFIKERAERATKGELVSFSFTSLCRFPLYEADFGWGKPIWVGSASLTFKNLIVFLDTRSGDGIEAWVNLKGEDMAKFEGDKELLAIVSPSSTTGVEICGA